MKVPIQQAVTEFCVRYDAGVNWMCGEMTAEDEVWQGD